MRAPRFLHVSIAFPQSMVANSPAIDAVIDSEAFDWLRYSPAAYILWTSSDAETVLRKILRLDGMRESWVLVAALNLGDAFASLPPYCWEWLKRPRGESTLSVIHPPPE